jgi:hypothetical protein
MRSASADCAGNGSRPAATGAVRRGETCCHRAPVSGSPLDFRFDVNYDRNDATQELIGLNQNASDSINRGREEIWSGTLDLELHLPLGGGVRAYFFGGGGAYNMTLSFGEPLQVPVSSGVKWFVEGRYNRVQQSNTAVPLEFIPITMGLRF